MKRFVPRLMFLALPLLVAAGGCGRPASAADAGPTFVADQGDFTCYRTWNTFDGGTDAFDGLEAAGEQRTLYLNKLPPPGSTTFPLGTLIVKETETAPTYAMAKRGGGFNPSVDDWEWFELVTADTTPRSACTPLITWRGTAPPVGTPFGGQFVSCNGCHAQAGPPTGSNDFVAGDALSLSQL